MRRAAPNRGHSSALIGTDGSIVAQSGGFTVEAAYPTLPNTAPMGSPSNALRANGDVYIAAGEDLSDNGIVATLVLENTVDLNGDGVMGGRASGADANPECSGEITTSRCNYPDAMPAIPTNCAPPGHPGPGVLRGEPAQQRRQRDRRRCPEGLLRGHHRRLQRRRARRRPLTGPARPTLRRARSTATGPGGNAIVTCDEEP